MSDLTQAFNGAATALRESARVHKRASSVHRTQARASMEALAELKEIAAQHGISLVIQEPKPKRRRGKTHGQN